MFNPVNSLEKSLISAATNPSYRPQFYRDLLVADVFIIQYGIRGINIQNNVLQEGSEFNIRHIERDGKAWLPIFSSLELLQQFIRSDSNFLQLKARDFFEVSRGAYVVLNPGFDYGKEFVPQEIAGMLDGSLFRPLQTTIVQKETQVLIGQPANYPHKLVKELSEFFSRTKDVNRAYLVFYQNPESGEEPHLLIGVDASDNVEEIIAEAGIISSEFIEKDEVIDFIRLGNSELFNTTKPFYQKSFLKKCLGKN